MKKYHRVLVMTEEDCRADDERRRKKNEKNEKNQNKTFLEWISEYLKETDTDGRRKEESNCD